MSLNKARGHIKIAANPSGKVYLSIRYPLRASIMDNESKPDGNFYAGFPWLMYYKDGVRIWH